MTGAAVGACTASKPSGTRQRSSDTATVSSVERAERNVSIDNIARIAKGLQVEPWKLLKND
jgi:hypothetical protein